MNYITNKQIPMIWALSNNIDMSEKTLRNKVKRLSDQRSIKELTKYQGIQLIKWLLKKGHIPAPRNNPKVIALATPNQLNFIDSLIQKAGWDKEHLMNFITSKFKRDNIRKLRRSEAGVIIKILNTSIKKKSEAVYVIS